MPTWSNYKESVEWYTFSRDNDRGIAMEFHLCQQTMLQSHPSTGRFDDQFFSHQLWKHVCCEQKMIIEEFWEKNRFFFPFRAVDALFYICPSDDCDDPRKVDILFGLIRWYLAQKHVQEQVFQVIQVIRRSQCHQRKDSNSTKICLRSLNRLVCLTKKAQVNHVWAR